MWCWNCGECVDWGEVFCPECDADLTDEGGSDYHDDEYPFNEGDTY